MTYLNELRNNQPVARLRDGTIEIAIFRNEGEKGPYFKGGVVCTYKDANGEFADINSFSGVEWLRLSELAREAYHRDRALRAAAKVEARAEETSREHHGTVAGEQV